MTGKIQQLRDIFGYRELYPKPAGPDRIEAAAGAYLEAQPATFEAAANALDAGTLKPDALPKFIQDGHLGPANDLAAALKDAGSTSTALRRAAAAQRKRMR